MKSERPLLSKLLFRLHRKYYPTKDEAEAKSKRGERIYYEVGKGWYIIAPRCRQI